MPLKLVRNNIIDMNTEAIVNPTNTKPEIADGCDKSVYEAAGSDELLRYRKEHIGNRGVMQEGEAFITPAFNLNARNIKNIIHAVSPAYIDGKSGEEEKLRSCYRKSLQLAKDNGIKSIAFPVIATGSCCYPKKNGLLVAIEEINRFLSDNDMLINLVVFGHTITQLGNDMYQPVDARISYSAVQNMRLKEYGDRNYLSAPVNTGIVIKPVTESGRRKIFERVKNVSTSFADYLIERIKIKDLNDPAVYKNAGIDKKTYNKIINGKTHPTKNTAMMLCMGARLNLCETGQLLSRAGYALSDSDERDIIFQIFIEDGNYDIRQLDEILFECHLPTFNKCY